MIKLKDILIEGLGCPTCTRPKAPLLIESTNPEKVSPNMLYHVYKNFPLLKIHLDMVVNLFLTYGKKLDGYMKINKFFLTELINNF